MSRPKPHQFEDEYDSRARGATDGAAGGTPSGGGSAGSFSDFPAAGRATSQQNQRLNGALLQFKKATAGHRDGSKVTEADRNSDADKPHPNAVRKPPGGKPVTIAALHGDAVIVARGKKHGLAVGDRAWIKTAKHPGWWIRSVVQAVYPVRAKVETDAELGKVTQVVVESKPK